MANCMYHEDLDAVSECSICGKPLCYFCSRTFGNVCSACASTNITDKKIKYLLKIIIAPVVAIITGIIFILTGEDFITGFIIGWLGCGIPYGWRVLKDWLGESEGIVSAIIRGILSAVIGGLIGVPYTIFISVFDYIIISKYKKTKYRSLVRPQVVIAEHVRTSEVFEMQILDVIQENDSIFILADTMGSYNISVFKDVTPTDADVIYVDDYDGSEKLSDLINKKIRQHSDKNNDIVNNMK